MTNGGEVYNGNSEVKIGEFFLVAMITLVSNQVVQMSHQRDAWTVVRPGSQLGWLVAVLLVVYLVFVWVKFEAYLRSFGASSSVSLGVFGHCTGALLIASAALMALDSDFGRSGSAEVSILLGGGLLVLILVDIVVVVSEAGKPGSYFRQSLVEGVLLRTSAAAVGRLIVAVVCLLLGWNLARGDDGILGTFSPWEVQAWHLAFVMATLFLSLFVTSAVFPRLRRER